MAKIVKIMDSNVLTLQKEAKISDAAKLIAERPQGCVVILEGKKPVGIITETDMVRNLVATSSKPNDLVTKIMSSPITSIHPNTKLEKASKIIDTKHFKIYPVVDNDNLVGLVTENSVVQAINDNIMLYK